MSGPISLAEFLERLRAQRDRHWILDGRRLRCDGLCPVESVFPQLRNAFQADDYDLLSGPDMMRIIDAADLGFSNAPDMELRDQLLEAVGLAKAGA